VKRGDPGYKAAWQLGALTILLFGLVWRIPRLAIWESVGGAPRVGFAMAAASALLCAVRLWEARGELALLGFAPRNWSRGWPALSVATALAVCALAGAGWWLGTLSLAAARWRWLEVYTGGIVAQQILLQSIFYCGFSTVAYRLGRRDPARVASAAAALVFAALHAPNPALMVGTLIAALGWTRHFGHYRNLPALMLSHLALGIAAMVCLGPGPLLDLRVGPDAWERLRAAGSGLGAQVGRGQRVGILVPTRSFMGRDPAQFGARMFSSEGVEFLYQLEVGDGPLFAAPSAGGPTGGPLIDSPHAELAVGVDAQLGVLRQQAVPLDQCGELHAIVGGVGVRSVAFREDRVVGHPHDSPAARSRIPLAGTIGEHAGLRPGAVARENFFGREQDAAAVSHRGAA